MKKTYIDKINDIVKGGDIQLNDIQELYVILLDMTILQGDYMNKYSEAEHKYQLEKHKKIVENISKGVPYNKSESFAMDFVEKKHGDYRINREKGKYYESLCRRLEGFIKFMMHKNKINMAAIDASIDFN